jgi:threonine dehydratase
MDLARNGPTYVSAYNDTHVIAGQASIGFELENQIPGPVTVVVPVGGGGLAAGLTLWAAGYGGARVVGVEAQASRAVSTTMALGHPTTVAIGATLADALAGNLEPGAIAPAILAAHATPVVAVSEAEIRQGMRYLTQTHGLAVEGAGATAIAALLSGKVDATGRVVAVVTGRNVALPTFAAAVTDDIGGQE